MVRIYGFNGKSFNIFKVLLTAEELGVEYEFIGLNPMAGEHKSPEHMKRHPLGKVPAIEHDGRYLYESNAICKYLCGLKGNKLYSTDLWEKALIDQWCDNVAFHAGRWLGTVFFEEIIKPMKMKKPADAAALKEAKGFLENQIPVIDQRLSASEFLAGKDYTVADVIAFSYFNGAEGTSVDFSSFPHMMKWYEKIKAREAYEKANRNFPELAAK
jgi:glutathione S-transferase